MKKKDDFSVSLEEFEVRIKEVEDGALRREIKERLKSPQEKEFRRKKKWLRFRYEALKRSNGKCELCGRGSADGVNLQVDHILPRSRYPKFEFDLRNLQVLCEECNYGKGASDTTDWRK